MLLLVNILSQKFDTSLKKSKNDKNKIHDDKQPKNVEKVDENMKQCI